MTDQVDISPDELHAFVDGELPPERATAVAAAVAADPGLRRQVDDFRADKALIASHYGSLIDRPLPLKMQAMLARGRRPRFLQRREAWMALAASIVLAVLGWMSFSYVGERPDEAMVAEALAAHTGIEAGNVGEVSAARQTLREVLDLELQAPDLSRLGYTLAGVRTLGAAAEARAVLLDYRDARARVFTLYMRRSTGDVRFEMLKQGETRICVWQDDVLGAVMMGEMSAGEMLRLASAAYSASAESRGFAA
jgi:anti-sigma factor RsiW